MQCSHNYNILLFKYNLYRLLIQTIVDAPSPELASALGFQEKKAEDLKETLQRVLDRREEERQSKELLRLYLKAVEKENEQQEEPGQYSRGGREVSLSAGFYFYSFEMVILKKDLGHFTLTLCSEEVFFFFCSFTQYKL